LSISGGWNTTITPGDAGDDYTSVRFQDNATSYVITGENVVPASITIIQTEESVLDEAEQNGTLLYLNAGGNWVGKKGSLEWRDYNTSTTYTSGVITFNTNSFNGKSRGLTGTNWIEELTEGDTHRFTIRLNELYAHSTVAWCQFGLYLWAAYQMGRRR